MTDDAATVGRRRAFRRWPRYTCGEDVKAASDHYSKACGDHAVVRAYFDDGGEHSHADYCETHWAAVEDEVSRDPDFAGSTGI
jgi:hypothetical protein